MAYKCYRLLSMRHKLRVVHTPDQTTQAIIYTP